MTAHRSSVGEKSRFGALLAAVAAAVMAQGTVRADYSADNTFDLALTNFLRSQALTIAGPSQLGYGMVGGLDHAILWQSSAAYIDLNPAQYDTSRFLGTNGQMHVGSGSSILLTGNETQALLWNGTTGSFTNLNPVGYESSYAAAIGGNQQVGAGTTMPGAVQNLHALLWTGTAASFVDLHPAELTQSVATGTNGIQQIGYGGGPTTGDREHALLWSGTKASVVDLTPGTYLYSYGLGIGGSQQVGYGGGVPTENRDNALLWTGTAASFVNLHPTGFTATYANATNDESQVGYGYHPDFGNAFHALRWSGTADSFVDLHGLLPGTPVSSLANSIDAYGNIAGYANYGNFAHAVTWLSGNVYKAAPGASAWSNGDYWSAGLPLAGEDLLLIASDGNGRTVTFSNATPDLAFDKMIIDATNGGTMQLNVGADTLNAASTFVGYVGTGHVSHTGGVNNVSGALTLGLRAGSAGHYALSGDGALNAGALVLRAGSYTQSGGMAVIAGATTTPGAGFAMMLSGGTFQTQTLDLGGATLNWTAGTLHVSGTGATATLTGVTELGVPAAGTLKMGRGVSLNALTVAGKAQMLPTGPATLNHGSSKVNTLTIAGSTDAWTGQLDLANNALVIQTAGGAEKAAALAAAANQVKAGRAGGTWTGNGITSSTILATPNTSLAVADNAHLNLTTFRGIEGLNADSLILVQARNGDATLNGVVDAFDLNILAANWQTVGKIWSSGDFTGDGIVDAFDLNVLAANWQFGSGGGLTASLESALAAFPQLAAVPEPGSLALLTLAAPLLWRRRTR